MPFFIAIVTSSIAAILAALTLSALAGESGSNSLIVSACVITVFTLIAIGVFSQARKPSAPANKPITDKKNPAKSQKKQAAKKTKPAAPKANKTTHNDADFETGQVKWFDSKKGFGFIQRENGEEIFVHHRSIEDTGQGRRRLKDGQTVEFRVEETDKGLQAEEVQVID